VIEREFSISAAPGHLDYGAIKFHLDNAGRIEHEFLILRTNLPETKLPLKPAEDPGGVQVDLLGSGIEAVEYKENDIPSNSVLDFDLTLPPGRYVLICNRPGHYMQGMHVTLVLG
jgi:uncharacterized cupredoxin-like copper-binding protein